MSATAKQLPTWEQMPDLDKGAALLHLHKIGWEGRSYAREHYPARYIDHPALTSLDHKAACDHAEGLFKGGVEEADETLGLAEFDRLYDLALDHERATP
ncbi:hypothetical protein [Nonomuraea sp. NPDC050310]|uniref:hypothetical protein n=1 Tax=Nonomuraea sp. NPDC050310 TaxID=3154935 RepID=UPI0033FDA946